MTLLRSVSILIALVALAASAQAQDFKVYGQMRERTELDARFLNNAVPMDAFHLFRTRLGLNAKLSDRISITAEFQDSRTFGEERTKTGAMTTQNGSAPAFDMRQGFIEVGGIADNAVTLRLGRTLLPYANERFMGLNDWGNFGQSFDAGRFRYAKDDVMLDVFGAALMRNANSNSAPNYTRDVFLLGTWFQWKPTTTTSQLHAFYLYDNPATTQSAQYRHTAGIHANGNYSGLDYELDAAYQFGSVTRAMGAPVEDVSIAANMIGVRVGYTMKDAWNLRLAAGIDRLSGNDPADAKTYGAFSTLYGTKHRFLGFMDYFTDIPNQTLGLGIQDIVVQFSFVPEDTDIKFAGDFHIFSTVVDPLEVASLKAVNPNYTTGIGQEFDLTVTWKMFDKLGMTAGYSIFNGDDERVLLAGKKTTTWGYLMTTLNF